MQINEPRIFNIYYFVDKDENKTKRLNEIILKSLPNQRKNTNVVNDDCNKKVNRNLVKFFKKIR